MVNDKLMKIEQCEMKNALLRVCPVVDFRVFLPKQKRTHLLKWVASKAHYGI